MRDGKPLADLSTLAHVVQQDLIPLLEEYCYEDCATLRKLLGKALVDVARHRVRHELFERPVGAALTDALLSPCPDLTTMATVVAAAGQDEAPDCPATIASRRRVASRRIATRLPHSNRTRNEAEGAGAPLPSP